MTDTGTSEAERVRREARGAWPGTLHHDGVHPAVDTSHLSAEGRVAAVWTATTTVWGLMGRELPDVPRDQWPGHVNRAP